MPAIFKKTNKKGIPTNLLYLQALSGSLFISSFVFIPIIKPAHRIINILAAQLYLLMYFLLFLSE